MAYFNSCDREGARIITRLRSGNSDLAISQANKKKCKYDNKTGEGEIITYDTSCLLCSKKSENPLKLTKLTAETITGNKQT